MKPTKRLLLLLSMTSLASSVSASLSDYMLSRESLQAVVEDYPSQRLTQQISAPLGDSENGYEAWLRYRMIEDLELTESYREVLSSFAGSAPEAALVELQVATGAMLGEMIVEAERDDARLLFEIVDDDSLGAEGFRIEVVEDRVSVSAQESAGLLYGALSIIRDMQLRLDVDAFAKVSVPDYSIRIVNHWDDPTFDFTMGEYNITRVRAGNSIFYWDDLEKENPRLTDYARMLASVGINAVVINNVNADPDVLETRMLPGVQRVAESFRPYNIRTYVSIPFNAPQIVDGEIGDSYYGPELPYALRTRKVRLNTLETSDPFDPRVQEWWAKKANEIYAAIPDFGGFLLKANSEGMPGPYDYGRNHADGANVIAQALAPHGGTLFYRTFVHGTQHIPGYEDRSKTSIAGAVIEFEPLDGQFHENVIIQTKIGPADFQSNEPPHPLFGRLPESRQALEVMAAQEYQGYSTHIVYQATYWRDIMAYDMRHEGGALVRDITSGAHPSYKAGAFAIVSNVGDDPNWFGNLFNGANLYSAGRLAWDNDADAGEIASDWAKLTFGHDAEVHATTMRILMNSSDAWADYAGPNGFGYMHEGAHHFEPSLSRVSKRSLNEKTIGRPHSIATGTAFPSQYHPDLAAKFESWETCPEDMLLFFHQIPWDHKMSDGRELRTYLRENRIAAVDEVGEWVKAWRELEGKVDPLRWAHVYDRLYKQYVHAGKWRDILMPHLVEPAN